MIPSARSLRTSAAVHLFSDLQSAMESVQSTLHSKLSL